MKIKRFVKKLGAIFALSAGVFRGADACSEKPALVPLFNDVSNRELHEYRLASLQKPAGIDDRDLWRVRVGAWEIAAGGYHTYLEFSPYLDSDPARAKTKEIYQIHGIACDEVRRTWAEMNPRHKNAIPQYLHGDYVLKAMGVVQDHDRTYFRDRTTEYVDIFYGSKQDVLKMYLDGMRLVEKISRDNEPYILLNHNSNSTERSVRDALGLPDPELFVPYRLQELGGRKWAPGLELSLLPREWKSARAEFDKLSMQQLEERAARISGAEKMFATFRPLPLQPRP
ncbi:MAG TPA: hypothetical protein VEF76_13760 [Patescibacteria group bacterium]|nr:hypothetical protein [Patescibacteria group bacterium]